MKKSLPNIAALNYALGVTSGSSALKVALEAMDVGPGDDVLVPAFTFLATYEAVLEVGAIPIMVDIDDTLNLDPNEIEKKMTPTPRPSFPSTCAVWRPTLTRSSEIARKNKLLVLEDNAQGCGASFKGKKLGGFGDMGTFSFDYVKTVTTGEGGMVITNNRICTSGRNGIMITAMIIIPKSVARWKAEPFWVLITG